MISPCQCTSSAESVSLNRSTVAATPSRNRITGPGTAPLYPMVLMVWSLAISTSAGPMRNVTSAGPPGAAASPVSPPRWHPASRSPDPVAMPERKLRRVCSDCLISWKPSSSSAYNLLQPVCQVQVRQGSEDHVCQRLSIWGNPLDSYRRQAGGLHVGQLAPEFDPSAGE